MTRLGRRSFLAAGGVGAAAVIGLGPDGARAEARSDRTKKPERLQSSASNAATGRRKVIEFGWDMPGVEYLRNNIATMEQTPFDGVVFNLMENPGTHFVQAFDIFAPQQVLTLADMKLDVLQDIQWGTFTDNFIYTYAYAQAAGGIDWFDDSVWNNTASKIALLGQALAASQAKGIVIDAEDYGADTWLYSTTQFPGRTFEEVCAQVRHRGSQFMTALQSAKPDVTILFLLLGFTVRYQTENYLGREHESPYATFPAFVDGVLSAMNSTAIVIDGSEEDYFWDETTQYVRSRQYIEGAWSLLSPSVKEKFDRIEMAASVYVDLTLGHARAGIKARYAYYDTLTASDVQKWYEHNVYHAMLKSDRYVWLYNEEMTFWNPTNPFPGAIEGIVNSKTKFNQGQRLGYDMSRYTGYLDTITKPAFTSSPQLTLTGAANYSVHSVGAVITLSVAIAPTETVHAFTFYDNGREVETSMFAPYRAAVKLTAGAHTFVVRAFRHDTTHVTSNPIIVQAQ